MDEFNHQIIEMVSSQDSSEKKGGILAIGNYVVEMFAFFIAVVYYFDWL